MSAANIGVMLIRSAACPLYYNIIFLALELRSYFIFFFPITAFHFPGHAAMTEPGTSNGAYIWVRMDVEVSDERAAHAAATPVK